MNNHTFPMSGRRGITFLILATHLVLASLLLWSLYRLNLRGELTTLMLIKTFTRLIALSALPLVWLVAKSQYYEMLFLRRAPERLVAAVVDAVIVAGLFL